MSSSVRILIKGAGDLATGIAVRLYRAGFRNIVMTEIASPTTVRLTVAFSRAVYEGNAEVEGIKAVLTGKDAIAKEIMPESNICGQIGQANPPIRVVVDEECEILSLYRPDILIDAIIAKHNTGTSIHDAELVIGVGPGFVAGCDCHAVVETMRGHELGRVYYEGSAIPNTGIPGNVGGYSVERLIRASGEGIFRPVRKIGDIVEAGEVVGYTVRKSGEVVTPGEVAGYTVQQDGDVPEDGKSAECTDLEEIPSYAQISGVIRGLLAPGVCVHDGMKAGDIDARCDKNCCYTVSDKARAIGGGVLEAVCAYARWNRDVVNIR